MLSVISRLILRLRIPQFSKTFRIESKWKEGEEKKKEEEEAKNR